MEVLRIGGATINQTPLDFEGNAARIRTLLSAARAQGVALLCLPELTLTGYGCEDAFFSLATARAAEASLTGLLPDTRGLTVVIGLPVFYYGAMYNCAAVIQDGAVLGINAKRVLPREGVHYEPRWFRPWPFGKTVELPICGARVPFGDIRYRLGPLGMAVEICEEAWDSVPASAAHADAVDLIVNPSASHFALGKYARREHLVANSSRALQVTYLYTNLVGCEAGRMIYDGGVLIAENGGIVQRGRRFGFTDGEITWRDIRPELARVAKLKGKPVRDFGTGGPMSDYQTPAADLSRSEIVGRDPRQLAQGAAKPGRGSARSPAARVDREAVPAYTPMTREQEFLHAEMLGLYDYLRKSGARGYVVSLSGGCDSAACALLVAHMAAAVTAERGPGPLQAILGSPAKGRAPAARDLVAGLLTCVYQRTANSSTRTESAARGLAAALGATFHATDVQPMVDAYLAAAAPLTGRKLNWKQDDVALQNIQARARAPLAWLLANVENKLLLTTSNRSEAAVGYATMDGDTAGGLAPLAGVDKHQLRQWLRWAETDCPDGLGPVAALAAVNSQEPTAELRPASSGQTDEADLMPYDVLDLIERSLVRDRLGPEDILQVLRAEYPEEDPRRLTGWLNRFFTLWARNQWKRERFAPGFHLDDESLDPKTWCRFPILSRPYSV